MKNSVAQPPRNNARRAKRELAKRELARRNLADFARYVTRGKWACPPHLALLCEKLESVERGEIKRLAVTVPPRHGKSWLCSRFFPAWFLGRNPTREVILSSYGADFAKSWGGKVREVLQRFGKRLFDVTLKADSSAKEHWEIEQHDGAMNTAGVGGPITGKGCWLLIIDDPVKNAEEANSETQREKVWDWYRSTAYSRLEPDGAVIVIMTRWHEDDLAGRLFEEEKEGGEKWDRLDFPAISEEEDDLGRAPGEALWPERFTVERLEQIKRSVGSYFWAALYQQRPTLREGNLIKSEWMKFYKRDGEYYRSGAISAHPDNMQIYATIDLAFSTKSGADWTVIAVWGFCAGNLWLLHLIRDRVTESGLDSLLRGVETDFNCRVHWVEEGAYKIGEGTIRYLRSQGRPIRILGKDQGASKDKEQRAHDATPRLEAGLVFIPETADWRDKFDAEIYSFPRAKHDDQVDAFVYGILVAPWGGLGQAPPKDLFGSDEPSKLKTELDGMRALGDIFR